MDKKNKKIVLVDTEPSSELNNLLIILSRNGCEFVTTRSVRKVLKQHPALINLHKYKPKTHKLSLAIIEPSMYLRYANLLKKYPILVDTDDFDWYINQVGTSHDGRLSDAAFNWLRMKVLHLSNHASLMSLMSSCRP